MPKLSWRASWWYIQSFWGKYRRTLLISIAFGIALVWLFPRLMILLPQQKQTHYIGRVGLFSWVDLPQDIQQKMSSGLTTVNDAGDPIPVLAERWTVEDSGRVFRFLLKENLRWQDGKPFVSEDVKYNFADVQTVYTENEVVFRLEDAYAPFPVVVSQPLFRQIEERRFGLFRQTRIIGLGEYSITSVQYNGPYVRQLSIENNRERLVYRFYGSEQDAFTAFRLGRVDRLEKLFVLEDDTDLRDHLTKIEETIDPHLYAAVFFNTSKPDLTREVRQALNYATKKPGTNDEKLRAISPIAPTSWAYNATAEVNDFAYNVDRALEALERADIQQPISLVLDSSIILLDEAQKVAQDWQEFGQIAQERCEQGTFAKESDNKDCSRFLITVEVQVVRDLQDFDAVLLAREVQPDPDQYSWWHSNQANNISQYQNPRVDKLLEDARTETDKQRRKLMYFEFQRYLVEDVPAIFLYYMPEYTVIRQNWL